MFGFMVSYVLSSGSEKTDDSSLCEKVAGEDYANDARDALAEKDQNVEHYAPCDRRLNLDRAVGGNAFTHNSSFLSYKSS